MSSPFASVVLAGTIVFGAAARDAAAQTYPTKPIRLIIPFGAGSTDILGRAYSARAELGPPLVGESVPGGGGVIGLSRAAKSSPDGYTIAIGASATLVVAPHT